MTLRRILLMTLMAGMVSGAWAATPGGSGGNAAISTDTLDNGGNRVTVGAYTLDQSIGGITGSSAGGNITMLHGYIAQLVEPVPSILSSPTATPNPANPGTPVTFNIQIEPGFIITWDFGDATLDTTNQPTVVHTFAQPGLYNVVVTVANIDGESIQGSVKVMIFDPLAEDSDLDGVSNEIEIIFGTDPFDPNSSPIIPGSPVLPLTITKMAIKLNFVKANADGIQISGRLPVPSGFVSLNTKLAINVGGVSQVFVLDAKGRQKTTTSSIALLFKSKKGFPVVAQSAAFTVRMLKGNFLPKFADEKLLNTTVNSQPAEVTVSVIFNGQLHRTIRAVKYTAKQFKSGVTK